MRTFIRSGRRKEDKEGRAEGEIRREAGNDLSALTEEQWKELLISLKEDTSYCYCVSKQTQFILKFFPYF